MKRLIKNMVNELKILKSKNKFPLAIAYETFGGEKGYKIVDGFTQLRNSFSAEISEIVIDRDSLKKLTQDLMSDSTFNSYYTKLSDLNSNYSNISITNFSGNYASYVVKKICVIFKDTK